jgi:DNA-binding FadR family transcriptional regulator
MDMHSKTTSILESYISKNGLAPQSRLPPERQLCEELGISRTELRKALSLLEADGKIWRHVGRGTFVGIRPITRLDDLATLSVHTNPAEVMQARLLLEPGLAKSAALHATPADIERMRLCTKRKNAALDWRTYERWDWAFHLTIAEATHNRLLLTLFNALNTVRESTEWGQLRTSRRTDISRKRSDEQHYAIIDAIAARDRVQAEAAMLEHLTSVHKSLLGADYELNEADIAGNAKVAG